MILFFDTETTGLPKNWKAPLTDMDNWPRMIQLAWIGYDPDGEQVSEKSVIIRPEGFTIPEPAARVYGITTERAMEEGVELLGVLEEFAAMVSEADTLVAHNMRFDESILGAELLRAEMETALFRKPNFCTMRESTDICCIPGSYGKNKWPRLEELHTHLFGSDFENAHDALADVQATARCYWHLKNEGIW